LIPPAPKVIAIQQLTPASARLHIHLSESDVGARKGHPVEAAAAQVD